MIEFLKDRNFLSESVPVVHGFFGRKGGVSGGLYAKLNCGVGTSDGMDNVMENRARVAEVLGAENLISLKQVHSATCLSVREPWDPANRPEGDAMVCDVPGIALGILTADCGPVLFYGEKADGAPVIGAAHAGWGGALRGVLESTVKGMVEKGARIETIRASLGPCIGPRSYEVSEDFSKPFLEQDPENEHFFKSARRKGHLMFDLPGYIAKRLFLAGVKHVSVTGHDTYAEETDYFSYRRAIHRTEPDYGRQVSAIAIR